MDDRVKNIKLIIWDMDETFWKGVLSEGPVVKIPQNLNLVHITTDCGIINSICSKNNFDEVKNELEKMQIWDFFVFPSIEWSAKGERVKQQIERIKLRAENVLFIDDSDFNLREVAYVCPGIMTLHTDNIKELYNYFRNTDDFNIDKEHKRLKQYKLLEEKEKAIKTASSNHEFLLDSKICVYIDYQCKDLERIAELISRTNQLNYTKRRIDAEETYQEIHNVNNCSGLIYVKDRFGEYGSVGFFVLRKDSNRLEHFLFSCRTLGMGIEQWIYEKLGFPELEIIGSVASELKTDHSVDWIQEITDEDEFFKGKVVKPAKTVQPKVLFKGPCDLMAVIPMVGGVVIDTEFNFINKRHFSTYSFNHSVHIRETVELSHDKIKQIVQTVPFMDDADFKTNMFSDEYTIVFYSLLPDLHEGVYKNKKEGYRICFNSGNYSLTDRAKWNDYISGNYENTFHFTKEILENFSKLFTFEGFLPCEEIISNILWIRNRMPVNTLLVLLTGSEIESEVNTEEFLNHAPRHKELNEIMKRKLAGINGIKIINPTKYISSQECFNGCTNHYSKQVYYHIAQEISAIINKYSSCNSKKAKVLKRGSLEYYFHESFRRLKIIFANILNTGR